MNRDRASLMLLKTYMKFKGTQELVAKSEDIATGVFYKT
jgi:hypothetical protein